MGLWTHLNTWLGYSIRRRLLDRDLEVLVQCMRGRVLEIGCGRAGRRGRFRPPIQKSQDWLYLDRRREVQPHLQGDIQQLPLRDAQLDTLLCLEVLEYVPSPQAALREMHRCLRPGGKLILGTPFLHRTDTPEDYWRFTENILRRSLEEADFQVQQIMAQVAALGVAVNILKYVIYAMPLGRRRKLLALALYLPLIALLRFDGWLGERLPVLRTFSTGYLVLAVANKR